MSGTVLIGLTGGIGSGKSTVSGMLAALGAVVIDADAISRSLTAAGGSAIEPIAAQFGRNYITPEGALDRTLMRALAYHDPSAKRKLEAIIHPLVGQATQLQAQRAMDQCKPCVIFDIPLLIEAGHWRARLHRVLVIDCAVETQIQRVVARNGLATSEVEKIIAAQASRTQRLAAADMVIHNQDLCLEDLRSEVAQIAMLFGL
jgi:dephospho-CoA kinase